MEKRQIPLGLQKGYSYDYFEICVTTTEFAFLCVGFGWRTFLFWGKWHNMGKNCEDCGCFQAYYVKVEDRFLLTNRGYCSKKCITSFVGNTCEHFENTSEKENFFDLTKENFDYVMEYFYKIAEFIGVKVDKDKIGECNNDYKNLFYDNAKLK